jgi:hypothetical protein
MRKALVFLFVAVFLLGVILFLVPCSSLADTVTVDYVFAFRDIRSANSINVAPGDRLHFGAQSVIPDGKQGTTGTATQGATTVPLLFHPFSVSPLRFETSVAYDSALTSQWTLAFTNGLDTMTKLTPPVGNALPVPFVRSVAISGSGLTPTFTWAVPSGFTPDVVTAQIWDLQATAGQGWPGLIANLIHTENLPGTTTTFTVPTTLQQGHSYSFAVWLVETRQNGGGPLSVSESFFDFVPLPQGSPPSVYLPTVIPIPGSTPVYSFDVAAVVGGQQVFIDPLVAIGYDYAIGQGNPKFASVTLPTGIGDNLYDLWLFNGSDYVFDTQLTGGQDFFFGTDGVDRFRILGIETSAGLGPNNSTAFITGLTFKDNGEFTGTMTPITTSVPEPATMVLLLTGLIGVVSIRKLRSSY